MQHHNGLILVLGSLLLTSLASCRGNLHPHEPLFTLPFSRDLVLTVWEAGDDTSSFYLHATTPVVAPQDTTVLDAREGAVRLLHYDEAAVLLVDDLDEVFVSQGDQVCAGDIIGKSSHVRMRAHWGVEEFANPSDMTLVRVIRNATVSDLSQVRVADQVHSAIGTDPRFERRTDINTLPCYWETVEAWDDDGDDDSAGDSADGGDVGDDDHDDDSSGDAAAEGGEL